jgi:hypothetical protein
MWRIRWEVDEMIGRRQMLASFSAVMLGIGSASAADSQLLKRFGAAKTRVQGGTRSGRGKADTHVLLSEEPALSSSAQPDLYWYLSSDFGLRIEISLTPVGSRQPLLSVVMKRGAEAGIHRLSLADQGVRLEEGQDYVFAATLVPDPTVRTADSSARGTLRYQPHAAFPDALAAAAAGYWIDAFDQADRTTRAVLLDDVNLPSPAAWLRDQTA